MDLCERQGNVTSRHPWELARLEAIRLLLRKSALPERDLHVLDVGCGDAFTSLELSKEFRFKSMTGVDTQLTDEDAKGLSKPDNQIFYYNHYEHLKISFYNLVFLMDVVEHVKDDRSLVSDVIGNYAAAGAHILITAPAYQFLFGSHDRFLRHYRRYNRKELLQVAEAANLQSLGSGYLFFSLLWIRLVSSLYERLRPRDQRKNTGVGEWRRGRVVTRFIEFILRGDHRVGFMLNQIGVKLPGLSVWVLCRKQPSSFPVTMKHKDSNLRSFVSRQG